ncbi:polymorphic toxin-type HINT domain-containing protein, partial [Streptomyces xanthophaeus]
AKAAKASADDAAGTEAKAAKGEAGSAKGEAETTSKGGGSDASSTVTTCNSFPEGIRVLMADGTTKPIEEVRDGDTVLATDPQTGETTPKTVTATITTPDDKDFTDLTLTDDANPRGPPAELTSTYHHPYWSESRDQWVDAGELKQGEQLRQPNGTTLTVTSVRNYPHAVTTHNLTVADLHTYYVLAGATPTLVHNCDVVDAARNSAAEYSTAPGRGRPGAVEALQVKGYKPIVHASDGGAGGRAVHPDVQNVLDAIPDSMKTGTNHGGCGLVACLTEALNAGIDPTGASAAAFMVRPSSHKFYLKEMDPCPSCAYLVAHFKLDFKTKW